MQIVLKFARAHLANRSHQCPGVWGLVEGACIEHGGKWGMQILWHGAIELFALGDWGHQCPGVWGLVEGACIEHGGKWGMQILWHCAIKLFALGDWGHQCPGVWGITEGACTRCRQGIANPKLYINKKKCRRFF